MERIASFQVNHDTLEPGVYVSRIDGDITTYDMRFIKPILRRFCLTLLCTLLNIFLQLIHATANMRIR